MTVHPFGATSSPGCANFALRHTASTFEHKYPANTAEFVRESFYVDDGAGGEDTTEETIELGLNSRKMCAKTGFNLTKYTSSDPEVIKALPEEARAPAVHNITLVKSELPSDFTLGVLWNAAKGVLTYLIYVMEGENSRRWLTLKSRIRSQDRRHAIHVVNSSK